MTIKTTKQYKMLLNSIETELIDIASLYHQCSKSELQKVAFLKAETIIELLKQYQQHI